MIAVLVFALNHHFGWICLCAESQDVVTRRFACIKLANDCPNPSPPSLMGRSVILSLGRVCFQPRAMALDACVPVSVPLNLSGAIRTDNDMPEI